MSVPFIVLFALVFYYLYRERQHMSKLTDALNQALADANAAKVRVDADLQDTFTAADLDLVSQIDTTVNAIDPAPAPAPPPAPPATS